MAATLTGVSQVVITRNDGSTETITVDPGTNLQAVVFDRAAADHCQGPRGAWPPPGVHFAGTETAPSPDRAVATTDSATGKGKPGGATPLGGCILVNGVMYCPS